MMKNRGQGGFTLVELLVVGIIIGLLSYIMSPIFRSLGGIKAMQENTTQLSINIRVANGLRDWVKSTQAAKGLLPAPYTANNPTRVKSVAANINDTASGSVYASIMRQGGLMPFEIVRSRASEAESRVRVYERSGTLPMSFPLFTSYGQLVDFNYNVGIVYLASCPALGVCNTGNESAVPGSVPDLSLTESGAGDRNPMTTVDGDTSALAHLTNIEDVAPVFISSLDINKDMVAMLAANLNRIRDAIRGNMSATLLTRSPTDSTNPFISGTASPIAATSANNWCHQSWIALDNTSTLESVGIGRELGFTPWGGRIEYCPDFDINNSKGTTLKPPYYAALRFVKNLSTGGSNLAIPNETNACLADIRDAAVGMGKPCNVVLPI